VFEDERDVVTAHGEAVTDTRFHEAPFGVVPAVVVSDVVAQPGREIPYGEAHARGVVASGDDEERDESEAGEGDDDEERGEKVEVEGDVDAAQRADEAERGDDGNEEAAE